MDEALAKKLQVKPGRTARAVGAPVLWVAYPKKTSALASDLDRDHGWEPMTAAGFDPVSQVAIDDTWSALRWKRDPALREARAARGSVLARKR